MKCSICGTESKADARQCANCGATLVVPTADQTINDRFSTGGPNYREFLYTLSNIAGQAQNFDGNGPYFQLQGGGGPLLVGEKNPKANLKSDEINFAHTAIAPLGTQPQLGGKPPLKPNVRCYTNPVPDVNGPLGQVGPASPSVVSK